VVCSQPTAGSGRIEFSETWHKRIGDNVKTAAHLYADTHTHTYTLMHPEHRDSPPTIYQCHDMFVTPLLPSRLVRLHSEQVKFKIYYPSHKIHVKQRGEMRCEQCRCGVALVRVAPDCWRGQYFIIAAVHFLNKLTGTKLA